MSGFLYKDLRQSFLSRLVLGGFQILIYGTLFIMLAMNPYDPQMTGIIVVCHYLLFLLADVLGSEEMFAGDERMSWQCFAVSTPGTMRGQVQSKYIAVLLMNIQVMVFSGAANSILVAMSGTMESSLDAMILCLFLWNVWKNALALPFIYGYGVTYGKSVKTVFQIGIIGVIVLYMLYGDISMFLEKNVIEVVKRFFMDGNGVWIMGLLPYFVMGAYYLSYRISAKIYRKGFEHYE